MAACRCHLLLVPLGGRPVLQPLLSAPELRRCEKAALVQKLADALAQARRDVRAGQDVEQVGAVPRVERVVLVCRPFCTRTRTRTRTRANLEQKICFESS